MVLCKHGSMRGREGQTGNRSIWESYDETTIKTRYLTFFTYTQTHTQPKFEPPHPPQTTSTSRPLGLTRAPACPAPRPTSATPAIGGTRMSLGLCLKGGSSGYTQTDGYSSSTIVSDRSTGLYKAGYGCGEIVKFFILMLLVCGDRATAVYCNVMQIYATVTFLIYVV